MQTIYTFFCALLIILLVSVILTHIMSKNKKNIVEGLSGECDDAKGKYNYVISKFNKIQNNPQHNENIKLLNSIRDKVNQTNILAQNIKQQTQKCKKKKKEKKDDKKKS